MPESGPLAAGPPPRTAPRRRRAGRLHPAIVWLGVGVLVGVTAAQPLVIDLKTDSVPIRIDAADPGDHFGWDFANCDFNGDGLVDLVVSAEEAAGPGNARVAAGEVYLILGRRGSWTGIQGIESLAALRIIGAAEFGTAGEGVDCGDIDGDGLDDIIVGATGDDGPAGSRLNGGTVYLVFGTTDPNGILDLAVTGVPVIYGENADDGLGVQIGVADVNGDATPDLAVSAGKAGSKVGGAWSAGRVYLLFGRPDWPPSLDLRTDSDTKIYGASELDKLGTGIESGDLNRDGVNELLIDARLSDGPGDTRLNAGEVHVFWGRSSWPGEIDLAVESADVTIYGPDPGDQIGRFDGISIGDLDLDGTTDLALGALFGDGPAEARGDAGEVHLIELGPAPPAEIDLGLGDYAVSWGADVDDSICQSAKVGDVNGDRIEDLACSVGGGDGPDNTRPGAGDALVFYGPFHDGDQRDAALGQHDLVVYGANANDNLYLGSLADLNQDGVAELAVFTGHSFPDTGKQALWLLSPYDTDGDGLSQLEDNCPLVANPLQEDSDGDLLGDACAGDYDGDGQADAEDCAPSWAAGGTPPEVTGLRLRGGGVTTLEWDPAPFSDIYDVERALLSRLDGSDYGTCQTSRDPNPSDTVFVEDQLPPAGDGFFFLVSGVNRRCPAVGSRGASSSGAERGNTNPAACRLP